MAEQAAGTVVNSAGTLVSAILESVGYHYQAHLLDQLTSPLTEEVGALLYLFGIALAVLMTATQGQYKMGVWLLIGPPMFFATIIPRDDIDNASWRFGRQIRDDAAVDKGQQEALEAAGQKGGNKAKVSKLFRTFVRMVSATQQEMVHVISSKRRESDLALVVRAELFSQIHITQFNKPGLERLFHRGMLGECGEALEYARAMNDPLYRPAKFSNPNKGIVDSTKEGQEAQKFFNNRKEYFKEKFEEAASKPMNIDPEMAVLLASTQVGNANSDEFHKTVEALVGKQAINCHQTWRILINYIQEQAAQDLEKILSRGAQLGVSRASVVNIIKQAHGIKVDKPTVNDEDIEGFDENDLLAIKRILSKYLMRNEFRRNSWGSRLAYWITGMESQDVRMRFAGKESFTEQARTAAQEWSEKERLIHAAGSLPYYQGLGLFLLSTLFPFFALLLLIPGKQAGFFLWFIMWIWLKSWDVAMAAVMLLDDVVFAMLSVQMQKQGIVQGQNELASFDLAFASINEMDPTYQLSTYYSIIATAILAIPPTTAHVIMGGLKGGAGLVSAGANRSAMQAGGIFLGAVEQSAVNALRNDFFDVKRDRIAQYTENAKEGRPPHAGVKDERGRLVYPMDGNPVKAPAFTSSAFGGLYNSLQSPYWTQTKNKTSAVGGLAGRQKGILTDAERAGAGAGLAMPESSRPAGQVTKNQKLLDIVAKSTTAADRRYGGLYSARVNTLEAELGSVASQAVWDAEREPIQMYRVNMMSVMGSLAIPSPNFALPYAGAEGQQAFLFKRFEQEQSTRIAEWSFRGDMASSFREGATNALNSLFDFRRAAAEGISNLGVLDQSTKQAIESDYTNLCKKAGKDGKLGTLSEADLRGLSPQTKNFLSQRMAADGSLVSNTIGTVTASVGVFNTEWMRGAAKDIFGSAYGSLRHLDDIGNPGEYGNAQGRDRHHASGTGGGGGGGGGAGGGGAP